MAVKGYFLDNESYSADDVNRAFSYLTTEGVSLFSDTGSVTSDLDATVASLVNSGVDIYNLESCKVYSANDAYFVKKGVCFLPDGAFVVVDDAGLALSITDGVLNYVYAMHDALKNECKIYVSKDGVPEKAVALAEIDAEGKITDKRVFATAKIAVPTANIMLKKTITITFPLGENKGAYTYRDENFDMGFGGFNFVQTEFEGKPFTAYVGDGKKVDFLDGMSKYAWVKKEGSSLVITTGTWRERGKSISEIELLLY